MKSKIPDLRIVRLDGKWEIRNGDTGDLIGPYDTRKEAEEDRQGLKRFYGREVRGQRSEVRG
jgi:hypothetical protein